VRSAEVRSAEVRPGEIRSDEVRSAEVGLAEVRIAEVRPEELHLAEVRMAENRAAEVRPAEVRPDEVRPGEVHLVEVRPGEVRLVQIRLAEIKPYIRILVSPPPIPYLDPLPQDRQVFLIRHSGLTLLSAEDRRGGRRSSLILTQTLGSYQAHFHLSEQARELSLLRYSVVHLLLHVVNVVGSDLFFDIPGCLLERDQVCVI
jgi:hypothetical protein